MVWTFSNPKVPADNHHIDSVCIWGETYAGGGFCSGIKYAGFTPALWAIWFTDEDMEQWTQAAGLAGSVDDIAQWRTSETNFTSSWSVSRWLPKEARNANYYKNEYRFSSGETVKVFSMTYTNENLYQKIDQ